MDLSALSQHALPLELFPSVLDRKAADAPDAAWASMPCDVDDLSKGFQDISWGLAAKAWNCATRSMKKMIGEAAEGSFPTIAYIGPSDLRYFFLTVAFAKLGYKTMLLQASLSAEGQLNLLERTGCRILAYGSWFSTLDTVLSKRQMKIFEAPSLEKLMTASDMEPYPFDYRSSDLLNAPALVLHTSGSTGLPKPVTLTYGCLAANTLSMDIPFLSGHINNWQIIAEMKRFYLGFPIAHAGGVQVMINVSAYNNATLVLVESGNLSGGVFEALIDYGKIGGTLIMPRPLIEISKSSSGLEKLSRLRGIIWSGGPLPRDVGDAIAHRTTLLSSWGTTESGAINLHATDPQDWEFIHVNPEYNRFRFDHKSSNLHEIVAMPHTNVGLRHHQKIFWNYPHASEWAFGDLFSPHPTKANLWKYEGRLDDMIIMDSGHNFHPMFYEQEILLRDQRVKGAVILGNGRSNLAVILEIVDSQRLEGANAFKEFWPLIETVNQRSTSLAQIPLQNIIIASWDRPLPRGGKGSVLRKEAEKIYEVELDTIYSCASARA